MTDFFALLGVPREPWMDAEELKEKFHALTAAHHPDVGGKRDALDFPTLNLAYQTLREPASCLRHFLQLEFPGALAGQQHVPENLAELFMRIGATRRAVDAFLAQEGAAGAALVRASYAASKLRLLEDVQAMVALVALAHDGLAAELKNIDWRSDRNAGGKRLADFFHVLAFLSKWLPQLREDAVRLQM